MKARIDIAAGFISSLVVWSHLGCATVQEPAHHATHARRSVKSLAETEQSKHANQTWAQFRAVFPYHIQTVAAETDRDVRYIVVSEPPPDAELTRVRQILHAKLALTPRHPIGYDGWAEDFVLVADRNDPDAFQDSIAELHQYLFGTSYRADVLPLPVDESWLRGERDVDLSVPADVLASWTAAPDERFRPVAGGSLATLDEIRQRHNYGVYLSNVPGLVAWVAPEQADLCSQQAAIRQFALDSDVVLGAIAVPEGPSVVLGRERQVPGEVLPPMRAETLLLLAATDARELSQSYERNHLFAGRSNDRDWDWAPIYLSDALIDTELGSLLNLADQVLKSWSLNGAVKYDRFNYPAPPNWPFSAPLFDVLGSEEVLFNWNTQGGSYVAWHDRSEVLTPYRTGALPIDYGTDDEGSKATRNGSSVAEQEARAYQYFAQLNNPLLARVVQYVTMYQVFRQLDFRATCKSIPGQSRDEWTYLEQAARPISEGLIKGFGNQQIVEATRRAKSDFILSKLEGTLTAEQYSQVVGSVVQDSSELSDPQREVAIAAVARALVRPRDLEATDLNQVAYEVSRNVTRDQIGRAFFANLVDLEAVRANFSRIAAGRASRYVHTPSVVLSRMADMKGRVGFGGHHIESVPAQFLISKEVPRGQPKARVKGALTLVAVHPDDVSRIPSLVEVVRTVNMHELGSTGVTARLQQAVHQKPAIALVKRTDLVRNEVPTSLRGLDRATFAPNRTRETVGWALNQEWNADVQTVSELKADRAVGAPTVNISHGQNGYQITDADGQVISAKSGFSARELLADRVMQSGTQIRLRMEGLEPQSADAFVRSLELELTKRGIKDPEVVALSAREVTAREARRDFAGLLEHHAAVRVPEPRITVDSEGRFVHDFSVSLPNAGGNKSIAMRIKLFLRERLSTPVISNIRSLIARILGASGRDVDGAAWRIRQELRRMHRSADVRVEIADYLVVDATRQTVPSPVLYE